MDGHVDDDLEVPQASPLVGGCDREGAFCPAHDEFVSDGEEDDAPEDGEGPLGRTPGQDEISDVFDGELADDRGADGHDEIPDLGIAQLRMGYLIGVRHGRGLVGARIRRESDVLK